MTYGTKLRLLWLANAITASYSLYVGEYLWVAILFSFLFVVVGGYAGWHRYFTHRSYQTSKFIHRKLLWWGALQGLGKPITVMSLHRYHHAHSDTDTDVHSPTNLSWWQITFGYYKEPKLNRKYIKDLIKDKEIKFLQKYYFHVIISLNTILLVIDPILPGLVFGIPNMWAIFTTGFVLNYLNHRNGKSNNNWLYALLTFGEGWHDNHHEDSKRYSNQIKWYQLDPTGWIIKYFLRRNNDVDHSLHST